MVCALIPSRLHIIPPTSLLRELFSYYFNSAVCNCNVRIGLNFCEFCRTDVIYFTLSPVFPFLACGAGDPADILFALNVSWRMLVCGLSPHIRVIHVQAMGCDVLSCRSGSK